MFLALDAETSQWSSAGVHSQGAANFRFVTFPLMRLEEYFMLQTLQALTSWSVGIRGVCFGVILIYSLVSSYHFFVSPSYIRLRQEISLFGAVLLQAILS